MAEKIVNFVQITDYRDHFKQRFSEFQKVVNGIPGVDVKSLAIGLPQTEDSVTRALDGSRPCIIAVNVHGLLGCDIGPLAGNFHGCVNANPAADPQPENTPPNVDENVFWNGYMTQGVHGWPGMKALLSRKNYNEGKPIYIIFAQCGGLQFAKRLRQIIAAEKDAPTPENVIIHGSCWSSTCSTGHKDESGEEQWQHEELQQTVQTIVKRERMNA
jgi:hypothetical protein